MRAFTEWLVTMIFCVAVGVGIGKAIELLRPATTEAPCKKN